jgi:hypothetical protein
MARGHSGPRGLPSRSSRTRPAFARWASARQSQPSIASRALPGKRDLHNGAVQPFRRMVVDGCPEILQISAGTAFIAAMLLVLTALGPGYLRQHEFPPKLFEAPDPVEMLLSV